MGLPTFGFVTVHRSPLAGGVGGEVQWLERAAATGRPTAHLWQGPRGLVAPRSAEHRPRWAEAAATSAAEGWPVQVRASGGGLVPQGPGVWNLSLAWPAPTEQPSASTAVYRELAATLAAALARLGLHATAQAVEGSFCDGRFNLAVRGRKLAGTAQAWRRIGGKPVVLAHAVILCRGDLAAMTAAANRLEAASGGKARFRAEAHASVAEAWCDAHGEPAAPADLEARCVHFVAEGFARVVPRQAYEGPRPRPEARST